jgi:hypothetical protein
LFVKLERYIRGRIDWYRLINSDYAVVSFGKSGRTWLRMLLSRFYQIRFRLPAEALLDYDNLHLLNKSVPIFHFTHDNYVGDYTGNGESKTDYYRRAVILLVRDPRDTAVSQYFQWKYRMRARKKLINAYPSEAEAPSIFDFVMSDAAGLPKILRFMNRWASVLPRIEHHHLLYYEDLRADQTTTLRHLLNFLGEKPTAGELADCIEFASVENMRRLELEGAVLGSRLRPADPQNPHSFKVRRAKVGGFRDYFSPAELDVIDSLVKKDLSTLFRYGR